jgi:signal transduction histidine kinase
VNQRLVIPAVAVAAVVAGELAVALTSTSQHAELRVVGHPEAPAFVLLIGWSFIGSGLIAWHRRPTNRFGVLMVAVGFAWFAAALTAANRPVFFSIGLVIAPLWIAIFLHALLSFPTGRLESRAARVIVAVYYFDVTVLQLAWVMFANVQRSPDCASCPQNVFLLSDQPAVASAILIVEQPILGVLSLVGALVLLLQRWRNATVLLRRALAPVLISGGVCLLVLLLTILLEPFSYPAGRLVGWLGGLAFTAVPLAFLAGLLRQRLAWSAVGDLVVELSESATAPDLREALSRALRDPSLQIGYWLPESNRYVDVDGRAFELPGEGELASTVVEHGGQRVAVLVHDASLLDDPDLIRAACAAGGLSLVNARLQAELRARVNELRQSQARIVEVGDAERRRLERNLHDGAQQQLLSVALRLRLVEARLAHRPDEAELVAASRLELERSLQELREVAHGIHPAVLSDHGLAVALEAVVARSPVPVSLTMDLDGRLPEPVEAAAYYLVCEALTNTARHAHASKVTVQISCHDQRLRVEVADDGRGGADMASGSGLRGLADRVAALDGQFVVSSDANGGSVIWAEIPCA